jgi:POT family proton-dependent oligopeptide transporter
MAENIPIMPARAAVATAQEGHPRGLYVLFFTEAWERYSFYSMMSILVLYMDESLRFSQGAIGQIYGGYIAAVYFMPLIGGWIADRRLGYNRSVIYGGILIALGHFLLALETLPTFYAALALLATGTGLLKPNISTLVGNLYRHRPELKDAAYNIYYMGINIGGFLGPLCVSWFRASYGWPVALGSAGVAMLVALGIFVGFNRDVAPADNQPGGARERAIEPDPPDARGRIVGLLVTFAIVTVFWLAFYQNGLALTLWARDNTETSWAPETFYAANGLFVILFTPPLVWFWRRLRERRSEPSTPAKLVIGMILTAGTYGLMMMAALSGGDSGKVSPAWLLGAYALLSLGEICVSPMGLSLVAKVAPPRVRGLMMGVWFLTLSAGGYLAGYMGGYWQALPHSRFFLFVIVACIAAFVILSVALRFLRPTFDRALAEG